MPATVEKLDLKRRYKHLYQPSAKQVSYVEVPELLFTMLDGRLEPGELPGETSSFMEAMGAMYAVGYTLKFMSKLDPDHPVDFTVMAVEGLWSTESGEFGWDVHDPWLYTLLMLQPDHITHDAFEEAVAQAAAKQDNPALRRMRLERWEEGPSLQIMHVGPYATEAETMARLDAFADERGLVMHGRHHEIYLGDPRRAKPENLKTVLRHPVRPG